MIFNEIEIEEDGQQVDLFPVGHAVLSFSLDKLPLYFKDELITSFYNMTGQLTQHYRMRSVKGRYQTIMVLLKPCAAYRLFGASQETYINHYFPILSLDAQFLTFEKALDKCKQANEAFQLIEDWLLQRFLAGRDTHKYLNVALACDKMLADKGQGRLSDYLSHFSQSKITIERHFKEVLGLNPKQFLTIARFNHAYHYIISRKYMQWIDVVAEFGYFDQAHFIKEFKRYCGFTPSQLHQSLYSIAGHVKELELGQILN